MSTTGRKRRLQLRRERRRRKNGDVARRTLAFLEALKGVVEGPVDWAVEHDHYLYGAPKRCART